MQPIDDRAIAYSIAWEHNTSIHAEWRDLFSRGLDKMLRDVFMHLERKGDISRLCPAVENVMAFARRPISEINVTIIGMDPYPNIANATGVAFSVPESCAKLPQSLRNIFNALISQGLMNAEHIKYGDLSQWMNQGVLLINYALTTIIGKSGAHTSIWNEFSRALISAICIARPNTIFMLFGADAQKLDPLITANRGRVLKWGHPSPMNSVNQDPTNAHNFIKCTTFIRANDILTQSNRAPIHWDPRADIGAPTNAIALCINTSINTDILDPLDELNAPNDDNIIYAFVDGACRSKHISKTVRNPCAGYGVIIIARDNIIRLNGLVANTDKAPTNNRAELCAMMELFKYVSTREFITEYGNNVPLVVIYDSAYAAGCVREWYERWINQPPTEIKLNRDIISIAYEKMKQVMCTRPIEWVHVSSHIIAPDYSNQREWFYWRGNCEADRCASDIVARYL